jgi:hypothetical protein
MTEYTFQLPAYFDGDAAEIEEKGYFGPVPVAAAGHVFQLFFYDPSRLRQEVSDSLESAPCFTEPGLVVLAAVTRSNIESALEYLASRSFRDLTGG